ncbi:hypothetical protein GGI42DRAFT_330238 [Trichoderma sp. SZMC 28013]
MADFVGCQNWVMRLIGDLSMIVAGIDFPGLEDDGTEQSTNNALIPPGKERYNDGENGEKLLYVCPVRDCRVLYQNMRALSSHFHGKYN